MAAQAAFDQAFFRFLLDVVVWPLCSWIAFVESKRMTNARPTRVAAVIVTFNRKALLERCLNAMDQQARLPDGLFVVDNASTDGTADWLADWMSRTRIRAQVLRLPTNIGGAGGFSEGMTAALGLGYDWIWMMDDDAVPLADALKHLLACRLDSNTIYSSCAIANGQFAWPIVLTRTSHDFQPQSPRELPDEIDVAHTPFLGIMVSASTIRAIGLPDVRYFLGRDDVEYCLRARRSGRRVVLVHKSLIEHPAATTYPIRILGRTMSVYKLPPWKRYYVVRNRIFIAKKYYGLSAYYKTAPAAFIRLIGVLRQQHDGTAQTRATIAGVIDGILGRSGRRHERWGLYP